DYSIGVESKSIAEIILIMYPLLSMWILSFPFIQEKFWNVKLVNGFQPLLTLPITIKEIWTGKIASIFVLSYPSTALIAIILAMAYYLSMGINPLISIPLTLWIFIFILGPLLIMVYNLIASWMALRFDNPRVIDILQYTTVIIFIFAFISAESLTHLFYYLNFTEWTMIIGVILIIVVVALIINQLTKNLKKEYVIN
ncbi:MAG: hypothetical protein WCF28_06645, partial [Methanobacterium sp.]|uniref:hypothetical protein n=1 Tax=Methanobacterium sp. TaxID=2164 RepID=UPI003C7262E7